MTSGYSSNKLPVFIVDVYCTLAYCHFVYATRYSIAERAPIFRVSGFHPAPRGYPRRYHVQNTVDTKSNIPLLYVTNNTTTVQNVVFITTAVISVLS